jgi:hypothetical protein
MAPTNTAKTQAPPLTGLAWLPVAWLVLSIALEGYRAWSTWWALNEYGLPPAATWLIEGELIVAAIIIIGGLFVLAAALGRMPIYPTAFTLWQGFAIAALVAIAIYTAIMPDFVLAPLSYVYWLGEILIGIACIIIVRRKPVPETVAMAQPDTANPAAFSIVARIIIAFLGVLFGGFIGFWIGLGIGIAISEATNMSCFEGACGYFAFFLGLAGVLVGAIIGLVLALYWSRRKKPAIVTP